MTSENPDPPTLADVLTALERLTASVDALHESYKVVHGAPASDGEGEVTGRGVVVWASAHVPSSANAWAAKIGNDAKDLVPHARAVYQDNARTTIVWLQPEDDPQAMRRHLAKRGHVIASITTQYGVPS